MTSSELLRVEGEVEFSLPPLAADEAVELFCSRARCRPDSTIDELCRRLEGCRWRSSSRPRACRCSPLGERVVLWSVDPTDWSPGVTARQIARRVLGAVRPGSIVILHDGGGDRSATVRALPVIVKGIRQRRLRLGEIGAR